MSKSVRVLLADDHPALRVGLRVLLERAADITVVSEVGGGKDALAQIEALHPDVVVLDCQLPDMEGTAVAAEVKRRGYSTRILALSAYSGERYLRGMIDAGAVGYLLKDEASERIVEAVRAAARGEACFSPSVAAKITAWARGAQQKRHGLTERELEVLQLVAAGKTNKEIGKMLGISEKAAEKHVSGILTKLGVPSRAAAAAWAAREGLG
ncbi:MAG: response regulator transcription factor [Chloroflexi bacterium]|nr:response regulator transcription factor [Chloroflexota bacterium]